MFGAKANSLHQVYNTLYDREITIVYFGKRKVKYHEPFYF